MTSYLISSKNPGRPVVLLDLLDPATEGGLDPLGDGKPAPGSDVIEPTCVFSGAGRGFSSFFPILKNPIFNKTTHYL